MENKVKKVAQLLGLELEEEFELEGLTTKYKFTEDGLMYWPIYEDKWVRSASLNNLITGEYTIIKLPKQILTDKEKEYLSNVIKPFRDKVESISKRSDDNGKYITIEIDEKPHKNNMFFPYFEADTMYKGMEIGKYYTLDELGL